jgi:pimeloyl-ACP methyl ester carboxylesterase
VWDRTVAGLAPTHRLHLVQVNGFAGAPARANAQGPVFAALVDEVNRYLRSQGLSRPAVIGHSMGGAAGMALAARHPGSVGRLLIVDSLPFFSVLMNPAATVESARPAAAAMAAAMKAGTPEQFAAGQEAALARMIKSPAARAERAREGARSDPLVAAQVVYDLMTTDLRPELGRIKAPVTVLYPHDQASFGTGPEAVDPIYARAYAALPQARLIRVDDSLHFIMDDQPERFAREVRAFLAAP